jgi:hypothetical protein
MKPMAACLVALAALVAAVIIALAVVLPLLRKQHASELQHYERLKDLGSQSTGTFVFGTARSPTASFPWAKAPLATSELLQSTIMPEQFPFSASNTSLTPAPAALQPFLPPRTAYVGMVRYINYGWHHGKPYSVPSPRRLPYARNFFVTLDADLRPTQRMREVAMDFAPTGHPCGGLGRGIEDIRVLPSGRGDRLHWMGQTCEYGHQAMGVRIVMGTVDLPSATLTNLVHLREPRPAPGEQTMRYEKNWMPLPSGGAGPPTQFVYSWYPFAVGQLSPPKARGGTHAVPMAALQLLYGHDMPAMFADMRGSSPPVTYRGALWCLTHAWTKCPAMLRAYLHYLVRLVPTPEGGWRVDACSLPFYWTHIGVQFCMSLFDAQGRTAIPDTDPNPLVGTVVTSGDIRPTAMFFKLLDIPLFPLHPQQFRAVLSYADGKPHTVVAWLPVPMPSASPPAPAQAQAQAPDEPQGAAGPAWDALAQIVATSLQKGTAVYILCDRGLAEDVPVFISWNTSIVWAAEPDQGTAAADAEAWTEAWCLQQLAAHVAPVELQWQRL